MKATPNSGRTSAAGIVNSKARQTRPSGRAYASLPRNEGETERSLDGLAALGTDVTLLRCWEVLKRVALGRTALYALIKAGKFPAPVKVGGASAWVDVEITQWIEQLMLARDGRSIDRLSKLVRLSPSHVGQGENRVTVVARK